MQEKIKKLENFYEKNKFIDLESYYNWFYRKLNINYFRKGPLYIKERQIWLAYIGKNIDGEQNGDEQNFLRPVLILKTWGLKVKHITIILLTTQKKNENFSFKLEKTKYPFLDFDSYLLIDKIKTISKKRVIGIKSLGYVNKKDFVFIKNKIKNIYFE